MTRQETIDLLIELGVIPQPRRCIVQLGRCGDILNILPAVRLLSQQQGQPVPMMVSRQYESVVNGLPYVEPVLFDGHYFDDFNRAIAQAKKQFSDVIVAQVFGRDYRFIPMEKHFNLEPWRICGLKDRFVDAELVLNRSWEREQELIRWSCVRKDKSTVLVNLVGYSSPFAGDSALLTEIRAMFPLANILDISALRSGSVSDLLGLYDHASCLVTVDTATLHLARGHPIPVIAICADGWNGTKPACNAVLRCTYRQLWHQLETLREVIRRSLAIPTRSQQLASRVNEELTVCITSFKRAAHLDRAIGSVDETFKVVVSSAEPTPAVEQVLDSHRERIVLDRSPELGCNSSWIRAAYYASTPYVLVLHDDDCLTPEFAACYRSMIAPAMKYGLAVTWRGAHLWESGKVTPTEYWNGVTRQLPAEELERFLLLRGLSLSPIVTVFDRTTLIHALKESEQCLTDPRSYLRPGMLLGTEIIAHLRQQQSKQGWLYVNQVLSHYGVHDGSGTYAAEKSGDLTELFEGYDLARQHFVKSKDTPPKYQPKVILVFTQFGSKDEAEAKRNEQADKTWEYHLSHGDVLPFPVGANTFKRSSLDIGDKHISPYVKDMFDYGARFAMPEDVIAVINRDICLTTEAISKLCASVAEHGAAFCPRRNMQDIQIGRLFKTVKNCKPDGGYDLFGVSAAWWAKHRSQMPDMFFGREAWDTVLRFIMDEQGGVSVDDTSYHSAHHSYWQTDRKGIPSQQHNRELALEFFLRRNNQHIIKQLSG